ncbi:PPE domain-containing protein [Amycolatopsis taiwanensis]|uniref:PPE domain-containing protein n=1 Tax=Amycolatopsis taiwanensis TaxID=342230 RepID=UPI0004813A91|nr:PPE domain-containing protein [Amycolatopsis taiwanensis]
MANGSLINDTARGAAIGTVIMPGVGTAVGGAVGGLVSIFSGGPQAQQHQTSVGGQTIDARQIYQQITGGEGPGSLQQGADAARNLERTHSNRADQIAALNKEMDAAWQGGSAQAAQAGGHPLETWLNDSAQNLGTSSQYIGNQVNDFSVVAQRVQPLPENPPSMGFLDHINPWSDKDSEIKEYNQKGQQNVDAFNAYYQASAQNAAGMPQYKAWTGNPISDGGGGNGGGGNGGGGGTGGGGGFGGGGGTGGGVGFGGGGAGGGAGGIGTGGGGAGGIGSGGHGGAGDIGGIGSGAGGVGSGGYTPPSWNDTTAAGYTPPNTNFTSGLGPNNFSPSSFGPGGGSGAGDASGIGGFGPGGAGSMSAGSTTGAAPGSASAAGGAGGAYGAAGARPGAAGAAGRSGMSGMGGAHGGRGQGAEDEEHQTKYLVSEDPNELFGTDELTAPPVIGE